MFFVKETLGDVIAERELVLQRTIRVPIPPLCQQAWERAQQDTSMRLGKLYALCEPLALGTGGHWHRESGDIGVVVDVDVGHTLARLLHELAHSRRESPQPQTIAGDWEEEIAVWEVARELAHQWDMEELIPGNWIGAQIDYTWELLGLHEEAANLAGTRDPHIARRAFAALQELAAQQQWTMQHLEDVIYGVCESDPDATCFNRGRLRDGWRLSYGTRIDFGAVALPQSTLGKGLLREALRIVAHQQRIAIEWVTASPQLGHRYHVLPPFDASSLDRICGVITTVLLDQPETMPAGMWLVYGDGAARLYHLSVSYQSEIFERSELWVLAVPRHERDHAAEAGFQQFIASWETVPIRFDGNLTNGLTMMFESRGR